MSNLSVGRWLQTDAYPHRVYCSHCCKTYMPNFELLYKFNFPTKYCPNCGAKMEEIREENIQEYSLRKVRSENGNK